jgi:hypothetical protein
MRDDLRMRYGEERLPRYTSYPTAPQFSDASRYAQNEVVLGRYAERIERGELATAKGYALTDDDRLRADLIERVMCDFQVDVGQVRRRHGTAPEAIPQAVPKLRALQGDRVIRLEREVLSVNDNACFLVRSVASAFEAFSVPPDAPIAVRSDRMAKHSGLIFPSPSGDLLEALQGAKKQPGLWAEPV